MRMLHFLYEKRLGFFSFFEWLYKMVLLLRTWFLATIPRTNLYVYTANEILGDLGDFRGFSLGFPTLPKKTRSCVFMRDWEDFWENFWVLGGKLGKSRYCFFFLGIVPKKISKSQENIMSYFRLSLGYLLGLPTSHLSNQEKSQLFFHLKYTPA